MAQAPVGQDLYREDPTVNILENQAADLLGKAAALFLPTGTMGDLITLKVHAEAEDEAAITPVSQSVGVVSPLASGWPISTAPRD